MKIAATGGSGFLGAHLIPRLVQDGHTVFALARSASSADVVRALGATPVPGDLDKPDELSLPAVDAVVHAAALFRFAGPRAPYFSANVTGTEAVLNAARLAGGAATFVYISAAAVTMDDRGTPASNIDESAPTYPRSFSGYIASKSQGEAAVLAANGPGFRTIALRPPALWGPGGPFSKQLPHAIESGQFAFIGSGEYPVSTIHVDNVVEAVQCALERGTGGRPISSTTATWSPSANSSLGSPNWKVTRSMACAPCLTVSRSPSDDSWKPSRRCAPTRATRR